MGYPLDNMTHLSEMLLHRKEELPDEDLIVFKSDISDAYHNLPMHPLWQIKQVNTIQKHQHIDCHNCFGRKGSGSLLIAFNTLVTWIGKNEYKIIDLAAYSDDSFWVNLAKNCLIMNPIITIFQQIKQSFYAYGIIWVYLTKRKSKSWV